jgi:hypothetical protein
MNHTPVPPSPLRGLGVTSLVLGIISLLLFFFPILGIPISAIGLALGIVGILVPQSRRGRDLHLCLYGILMCLASLGLDIAIAAGPSGLAPRMERPRPGPLGTPDAEEPPTSRH